MKRIDILTHSIAVFLLLPVFGSIVFGQGTPSLRLSESSWSFGSIRQADGNLEKSIRLHNDGTETLEILDLRVSCGCLQSKLDLQTIRPGESTDLVLKVVPSKQVGEVRKACTIKTNDPRAPIVAIPVEGVIRADWRIEQTRLNFGDCVAGTSPSLEFKVAREPDADLKLVRLECLDPNLIIESQEIGLEESGGPGWLVKATLAKTAPAGVYAAAIVVVTDHPTVPANHVMVYARIQGTIQVRPMSRMRFGRISSEQPSERRLTLTSSKDKTFKILSVEASTDDLLVHAVSLEGGSWTLQVSVKKDARVRNANESVLVHTDTPGQEAIRVPVSWTTFSPKSRAKSSPETPAANGVPSGPPRDGESGS